MYQFFAVFVGIIAENLTKKHFKGVSLRYFVEKLLYF